MNVEDLTIGQARQIAEMFGKLESWKPCPYAKAAFMDKPIMVRTVTMIYVGRLIAVGEHELTLVDVSWIPETGRWQQFIADGSINECEPYPAAQHVLIGRGSIIDVTAWTADLPSVQK